MMRNKDCWKLKTSLISLFDIMQLMKKVRFKIPVFLSLKTDFSCEPLLANPGKLIQKMIQNFIMPQNSKISGSMSFSVIRSG